MDVVYVIGGSALMAIEFYDGLTKPSTSCMIYSVFFLIIALVGFKRLRRKTWF
jgi:hypothetical protein